MRKSIIFTLGTLAVSLAATLSSCSSDDSYSPGEPTQAGAEGAYFSSANGSEFILEPEDSTFQVIVSRKDSTKEADVALHVVYADTTAIQLPEYAHFAAGQKNDTVTVVARNLAQKQKYNFRFAIDEKDADHYSVQDGTTVFDAYVIVSKWVKLKSNVEFYYYRHNELPTTYSDIYMLEGVNKFYITDFMGSGSDFYFTLTPDGATFNANKIEELAGEMVPIDGMGAYAFDYSTYKLNYVYLGQDANGQDVYNWSVGDCNINYLDWYGGYSYGYYSWIDFTQKYIYLYGYISSNKFSGLVTIYGTWTNDEQNAAE